MNTKTELQSLRNDFVAADFTELRLLVTTNDNNEPVIAFGRPGDAEEPPLAGGNSRTLQQTLEAHSLFDRAGQALKELKSTNQNLRADVAWAVHLSHGVRFVYFESKGEKLSYVDNIKQVSVLCLDELLAEAKYTSKRPAFFDKLTLDNQQLLEAMLRIEHGSTLMALYETEPKAWKDIPQPKSFVKRLNELQSQIPIDRLAFKASGSKRGSFTWITKKL